MCLELLGLIATAWTNGSVAAYPSGRILDFSPMLADRQAEKSRWPDKPTDRQGMIYVLR